MPNRRAKLEEAYSVQQEEWSAAVRMNWFSTVETRPWWTEAIASDHSSLKASNTDRVFIQRVWGDGDVYVTSRSLIVWPLSERPNPKRQQRMIPPLTPLWFCKFRPQSVRGCWVSWQKITKPDLLVLVLPAQGASFRTGRPGREFCIWEMNWQVELRDFWEERPRHKRLG